MSDNRLKDMLDKASNVNNNKRLIKNTHKLSRKQKLWMSGGSVAAVIAAAGMIFFMPSITNHNHFTNMTGQNAQSVQDADIGVLGEVKAPVKLEHWQQTPYEESPKADRKPIMSWANRNPQLYNSLTGEFNANPKLTSDINKVKQKGKAMNANYSSLTADNVKYTYTTFVNRLINPIFGNWYPAQFADNKPKTSDDLLRLQDMFTKDWWNKHITKSDYSALPVYADWTQSNFNHTKFKKSLARWYGKLDKQHISPVTDKQGRFKKLKVNDTIKYSAYDNHGNVMTKTGVLSLELVENKGPHVNPSASPLLINNASLSIK